MLLHSIPDDFSLHALWDTERSTGTAFVAQYYITDTLGNILTDPSGNRLAGYTLVTLYPQKLHAIPDDFSLHAE